MICAARQPALRWQVVWNAVVASGQYAVIAIRASLLLSQRWKDELSLRVTFSALKPGATKPGTVNGNLYTPTFRADDGAIPVGMRARAGLVVDFLAAPLELGAVASGGGSPDRALSRARTCCTGLISPDSGSCAEP